MLAYLLHCIEKIKMFLISVFLVEPFFNPNLWPELSFEDKVSKFLQVIVGVDWRTLSGSEIVRYLDAYVEIEKVDMLINLSENDILREIDTIILKTAVRDPEEILDLAIKNAGYSKEFVELIHCKIFLLNRIKDKFDLSF